MREQPVRPALIITTAILLADRPRTWPALDEPGTAWGAAGLGTALRCRRERRWRA